MGKIMGKKYSHPGDS